MEQKPWFATWFGTPWYKILYRDRNEEEAAFFIKNLVQYLSPRPGSRMLDMACGTGRHARELARYGFRVTGIDISPENIAEARRNTPANTEFAVHDMRKVFRPGAFDYIFNFFTSFGYFEQREENLKTLQAVRQGLRPEGRLLIDFLNVHRAVRSMVKEETIHREGIDFHISRKLENGFIIKDIRFRANGRDYHFYEKVQAITLEDFQQDFRAGGLRLLRIFGNYRLEPYDENRSDRLIMLAQTHD